ncbi:MAG TPA: PilX N-terminal domain-containing pilus assembly protein, partial [Nitrospiria bacterium]|nr:PilX N-terminal domain-containing pilus assembly protein [Nitrospiria bacterium]
MSIVGTKRGAALILALILLALATGFGLAFLRLSQTEMQIASNHHEALVALYLAESGVDEAISWFTSPER